MRAAAKEYGWNLNYGGIALMWRGGCIIRSQFLGDIKEAFDKKPEPGQPAARRRTSRRPSTRARLRLAPHVISQGRQDGHPRRRPSPPPWPTSTATAAERLPANLLQAQRDYFGAHTYERVDKPRGQFFHTNWTGTGGNVTAGTYNA